MPRSDVRHALTIDLEEWYHPELVRPHLGESPLTDRLESSLRPILERLDAHRVQVTFFCVGDVMRSNPALIQELRDRGHEIGFHGMSHRTLHELGREGFARELQEFAELVHEVFGEPLEIRGFRAPTFSLDFQTRWALPLIRDFGYSYDSSVFPARSPLYGIHDAPLTPYPIDFDNPGGVDPNSELLEFPPAVMQIRGFRVPVAGGTYLRVLPLRLSIAALRHIGRSRPFNVYLHPWETDSTAPRALLPSLSRLITYSGRGGMLQRVERLLSTFRFTTMQNVVQDLRERSVSNGEENPC